MRALVVILLGSFATTVAAGQTCTGNLPFSFGRMHAAANVAIDKHTMRYVGEFRFGGPRFFGEFEAGLKTWDQETLAGRSVVAGFGAGIELTHADELSVCPVISATVLSGPQGYAEDAYAIGVSAGVIMFRGTGWDIVPTAAVLTGGRKIDRTSCCARQTESMGSVAIGFQFSHRITLAPSVVFALGDSRDAVYGMRVALRLGKS
jgi:hypothetical protein